MKPSALRLARVGLFTLVSSLSCGAALAGRPLVVDDANVNDPGHGQLEAWVSRTRGDRSAYNLAPAYAPIENLELGALLTRDTQARETLGALQAKWRITPGQDRGCNLGAVLGVAHAPGTPNTGSATKAPSRPCRWGCAATLRRAFSSTGRSDATTA